MRINGGGGGYIPEIDAIRAIAFLLVVIVHFSIPTYSNEISKMGNVIASIIHLGWFGVPIFLFISGYSLGNGKLGNPIDIKIFLLNRILRIYPLYLLCIFMLLFTNSMGGLQFILILLMQTQEIPKLSPFGVLWTIQLEFFCYLLFPVLITNLQNKTYSLYFFGFLILIRLLLYFLPLNMLWSMSYQTIFGGATLFAAGIICTKFPPFPSPKISFIVFLSGVISLIGMMNVFYNFGGDHGFELNNNKFTSILIIMPELISIILIFIVVGLRGLNLKFKAIPLKMLVHIGRISYSGYIFHLFVLDFFLRVCMKIDTATTVDNYLIKFMIYLLVLIGFSHISYKVIELPFLRLRKKYAS